MNLSTLNCKLVEDKDLIAVEITLPDGTTRHLVLPPTKEGKEIGQDIVAAINKEGAV